MTKNINHHVPYLVTVLETMYPFCRIDCVDDNTSDDFDVFIYHPHIENRPWRHFVSVLPPGEIMSFWLYEPGADEPSIMLPYGHVYDSMGR